MSKRIIYQVVLLLAVSMLSSIFQPFNHLSALAQPGCQTFRETGKSVCGRFLQYWQQNGGLAQQGLPLSSEFLEVSDLNGKSYTVQYFERAVFEKHPENAAPYDVLLSQLGTFQFKRKYPNGEPAGTRPTVGPNPTLPPTGNGPKLDVVDFTSYTRSFGGRVVVGLARNTGNALVGSAKVVASFKDGSGKIIGTASTSCSCILKPGDFWPFGISVPDASTGFASVAFQTEAKVASDFDKEYYYSDYQVVEVNVVPPSGYDGLTIVGTVKNIGSVVSEYAYVYIAVLDAAGKVVDVNSASTELDEIAPGQSSPFKVEFDKATQAPGYKIVVYGHQK